MIENGNVSPESVLLVESPIGTTAEYTCDEGFFPNSETLESVCRPHFTGPGWSLRDGPRCAQGKRLDTLPK